MGTGLLTFIRAGAAAPRSVHLDIRAGVLPHAVRELSRVMRNGRKHNACWHLNDPDGLIDHRQRFIPQD